VREQATGGGPARPGRDRGRRARPPETAWRREEGGKGEQVGKGKEVGEERKAGAAAPPGLPAARLVAATEQRGAAGWGVWVNRGIGGPVPCVVLTEQLIHAVFLYFLPNTSGGARATGTCLKNN